MRITALILGTLYCLIFAGSALGDSPIAQKYFRAKHGFNRGREVLVDLTKMPGFDKVTNLDDIARFARSVPGAVGFTAHPEFEKGTRLAHAVISYSARSPTSESWKLYLYDKSEADKLPDSTPQ